jgi:RNA polymerase sigma-70 factor (ECF subfamily)
LSLEYPAAAGDERATSIIRRSLDSCTSTDRPPYPAQMTTSPSATPSGLEAVFLENRPALLSRARGLGAGDDAEDVLQDVWIRLRSGTGPIVNPRAYLFRMVYTAVLDRRRGARRSAERENAWLDQDEPVAREAAAPEAERRLVARQALEVIAARLDALGDPAALIFRRHRIGGETQRRIAEDLGMGLSTVEKHLRRAYAVVLDVEDEA